MLFANRVDVITTIFLSPIDYSAQHSLHYAPASVFLNQTEFHYPFVRECVRHARKMYEPYELICFVCNKPFYH